MSSLPSDVLEDILHSLDQWTLDGAPFTEGRFRQLISERLSVVCLRKFDYASFRAPGQNENVDATSFIRIDALRHRLFSKADRNTARLFADFVRVLRCSRVTYLVLYGKYMKRMRTQRR